MNCSCLNNFNEEKEYEIVKETIKQNKNLKSNQFDKVNPIDEDIKSYLYKGTNYLCFDCGSNNVMYINYIMGVFLCTSCASYHKELFNDSKSKRIKTIRDKCNDIESNILKEGGNSKLYSYLKFYNKNLSNEVFEINSIKSKYLNKAMEYYVEKLHCKSKNKKFNKFTPNKITGLEIISKSQLISAIGTKESIIEKFKNIITL